VMKTVEYNMWIVVNCCDLIRENRNIPVRYKLQGDSSCLELSS